MNLRDMLKDISASTPTRLRSDGMADGIGCKCEARNVDKCGCGADWTPQEVYDLRDKLAASLAREKVLEEALTFYSDCDMCDQCEDLNDDEDGGYDASYTAREALSRVKAMREGK